MDPTVTLQLVVQLALADARQLGQGEPEVARSEQVVWRDGALGCPQPGRAYSQALVPGFRVQLRVGGGLRSYHAGPNGQPRYCPADQVQDPLPDPRS